MRQYDCIRKEIIAITEEEKRLSQEIKQLRKSYGLTQAQVGKILDVTGGMVHAMEKPGRVGKRRLKQVIELINEAMSKIPQKIDIDAGSVDGIDK